MSYARTINIYSFVITACLLIDDAFFAVSAYEKHDISLLLFVL